MILDKQVSLLIISPLLISPCIKYHEGRGTNFFSDTNILVYIAIENVADLENLYMYEQSQHVSFCSS